MKPILPSRRYGWVLRCLALAVLLLVGRDPWARPTRMQTISGKVTDEKGEAMAGVSVREKIPFAVLSPMPPDGISLP
ncbi:hypothetical protein [Siphonobacter sp. BAB-5385]|uniref:hypothetical protein n=1 Tax=Siphonobacter sp. BAB-5385 TaxID=1864822 RepID=UPI0011407490|nr:hypothetical protein [Siphonobacter sp. BAB-5385]